MKYMGIALILLSGVLAGCLKYLGYSIRVRKLESYINFLSEFKSKLMFSSQDFKTIVLEMEDNLFSKEIIKHFKNNQPITALNLSANTYFTQSADKASVNIFASEFGKSDMESQINLIERCQNLAKEQYNFAVKNMSNKAKLYLYLYSFCGIAVAIIFI